MTSAKTRDSLVFLAYVGLYVFLDWVSYIHPVAPFAITPWNPPPGLSLILLLGFGLRFWPALFVGAVLAEAAVRGLHAPLPLTILSCALTTAGYTGAAALLTRKLKIRTELSSLRDLNWFLGVVVAVTLPIAATYVAMFLVAGMLPPGDFLRSVVIFWVGDVIGIIVTTPLFLVHRRPAHQRALMRTLTRENLAQAIAILAALWLVFGWEATDPFKYFYLLFLPLIWIAMRHGNAGATLATLAIQLGLIAFVHLEEQNPTAVLELQMLMFALATTGLFLGTAVTERQRAASTLAQRDATLNHALRLAAASEMASALAHELGQPLSAIGSYVSAARLMLDAPPERTELLRDTMDKAVREVSRAGQVVHRLREFFRGGTTRLEQTSFNERYAAVQAQLSKRAEQAGVQLKTELTSDATLFIDTVQIDTVLYNLIGNAIDALSVSAAGPREILVRAERDADWLKVEVRDTGPGISEELDDTLFEPFVTSKTEGLGLGLAISRSIVEAHGGRLWHEPSPRGARFVFTLPINGHHDVD